MRRRFIFCECERRNRSGVPPRSAWVKLAGPLPANVSLLGASGLRPAPLFVGPWGLAGDLSRGASFRMELPKLGRRPFWENQNLKPRLDGAPAFYARAAAGSGLPIMCR
jgi:hypothetical protein